MNLQRTPKGSCGSSFSGQLLAEVEIRVNEGGTSLHKTFRKINLVFKGIRLVEQTTLASFKCKCTRPSHHDMRTVHVHVLVIHIHVTVIITTHIHVHVHVPYYSITHFNHYCVWSILHDRMLNTVMQLRYTCMQWCSISLCVICATVYGMLLYRIVLNRILQVFNFANFTKIFQRTFLTHGMQCACAANSRNYFNEIFKNHYSQKFRPL